MSQTKFIGVIKIDSLRYLNLINLECKTISRSIVFKKFADYLPQTSLRSLFYTIVYPHAIYAMEVWGSSSQTQVKRLRRLIDKCLKIICEASRNGIPVDTMFLSFDQLYKNISVLFEFSNTKP